MRILQIGNNAVSTQGGIHQAISDIRRSLGGSIVSFTNRALLPQSSEDILHIPQAATWPGQLYGWAPPGADQRAAEMFGQCDIVLIHGLFRYHYQWAVRHARRNARPYLVFPHGALDPEVFTYRAPQKELWWRLVGQPGLDRAAGAVFITGRERDKAAQRARLPAACHVVHLPVDAPPLNDSAILRQRARLQLGIDESHRILLFLGRFDPIKRLPAIIGAFNLTTDSALHLVIAGPDTEEFTRADCRRLVATDVAARVHLTGAVYGDDKRALLAAADGFVSASARENFGYSLCEALSSGLPALVGPGTDLSPELHGSGSAWLLPRDDVAALADAYAVFARTPAATLREMGQKGRQWVETRLNRATFGSRIREVCAQARVSRS